MKPARNPCVIFNPPSSTKQYCIYLRNPELIQLGAKIKHLKVENFKTMMEKVLKEDHLTFVSVYAEVRSAFFTKMLDLWKKKTEELTEVMKSREGEEGERGGEGEEEKEDSDDSTVVDEDLEEPEETPKPKNKKMEEKKKEPEPKEESSSSESSKSESDSSSGSSDSDSDLDEMDEDQALLEYMRKRVKKEGEDYLTADDFTLAQLRSLGYRGTSTSAKGPMTSFIRLHDKDCWKLYNAKIQLRKKQKEKKKKKKEVKKQKKSSKP
jgi:hypothetical protein